MDTNNTLVDDFLGGAGSYRGAPQTHSTPSDEDNGANVARDPQALAHIFTLQQRLSSLMEEAQDVIRQLQYYGMFPRMTPQGNEAVTLLMGLYGNSNSNSTQPHWGRSNNQMTSTHAAVTKDDVWSAAPKKEAESPPHTANSPFLSDFSAANSNVLNNTAAEEGSLDMPLHTHHSAEIHKSHRTNNQKGYHAEDVAYSGEEEPMHRRGATSPMYSNSDSGAMLAFVEFKRHRIRKYVCEDTSIEPGAFVLVDGDRGTDCGLLVQTIVRQPNGEASVTCMDGCDVKDEKVKLENGRVLRAASNDDIDRLHNIITNAEAVAIKTCRERCQDLGIDINLIDVEYQFDMKKISFFFDCDHSVDFRGLVRELYRTFGARIWMENINPKVKNSMPSQDGYHREGGAAGGRKRRN